MKTEKLWSYYPSLIATITAMKRRNLLMLAILGATTVPILYSRSNSMANEKPSGKKALQLTVNPEQIEPFELDPVEWKMRLSEQAFYVLREEGTEAAFSSELNDEKRVGQFVCSACSLALFESVHKYDSGTGWPSFWQPINGRVKTKTDFKLILPRTEYHCARCGGHQGHVFKDGPKPTGLRYCNNGVALAFKPA